MNTQCIDEKCHNEAVHYAFDNMGFCIAHQITSQHPEPFPIMITQLQFIDAPGVIPPTSTKVYLDPSILSSPPLVDYVFECRSMLVIVATVAIERLVKRSANYGSNTTVEDRRRNIERMVRDIDAIRFFNGDSVVERVLRITDEMLATPIHLAGMDMVVEFYESIGQLAAQRGRGQGRGVGFGVGIKSRNLPQK